MNGVPSAQKWNDCPTWGKVHEEEVEGLRASLGVIRTLRTAESIAEDAALEKSLNKGSPFWRER